MGDLVVPGVGFAVSPARTDALVCEPWAASGDVPSELRGSLTDQQLADGIAVASDVLYLLAGNQFPGHCIDVVRPCAVYAGEESGRWPWGAERGWYGGPSWNGEASQWGFCLCNRTVRSGCTSVAEILLPGHPVVSVTEVLVDGLVVAAGGPGGYRVDDDRWLVRRANADGTNDGWPCCQRMDLPVTEVGTWQVTFTGGMRPPPSGLRAAATLGLQLAFAFTKQSCTLPPRVTSIVYQGASAIVQDPQALLDKGRTGLLEVDLFLTAVNPNNLRQQAQVWTPHIGERVRRAGQ